MWKGCKTISGRQIAGMLAAVALSALIGCTSISTSHRAFITLRGVNGIAPYRINNNSAAFTSIIGSPFDTGLSPSSVVAVPSGNFVYVANQGESDISLFKADSQSGLLTEVLPRTPSGIFPSSLALDSAGAFLYVANQASNNISVYSINASNAALTAISGSPFATGPSPTRLRVSPSGKYLYVLGSDLGTISVYAIVSGVLQPIAGSPFAVGPTPSSFAIDSAEHYVYVTNTSTSTVSVFAINATSGALTAIPLSPFNTTTTVSSTTPVDVAIGTSGQYLYVLNSSTANISEYSIAGNGVLTLLSGSPATSSGTGPVFILYDPSGNFLYAGDQTSNTIDVFSVASDGILTSIQSPAVGASPSSMFVLP
jgi:6-phosphogluconolactonase